MAARQFHKMHGLGNDFVVVDARRRPFTADTARIRALSARRTGIGCDQFITLEPPADPAAAVFMRIHNADGGEVEACGNAARCVARLLLAESGTPDVTIETTVGLLGAQATENGDIAVDMGPAAIDWQAIPLAQAVDTLAVPVTRGTLSEPVAVNMGNPHAVFFVEDAEAIDLETLGPQLEHDPMFPERANIEVCHLIGPDHLRMRVWERGVGITQACGTGACAAVVAAARRRLTGRAAAIDLDGGTLHIDWRDDNHVIMTGPTAYSFSGEFEDA